MDPNAILVWANVAGELVKIGRMSYASLKAGVADDPDADTDMLDRLDADYDARIAAREDESDG
jgi:hypothetical protein